MRRFSRKVRREADDDDAERRRREPHREVVLVRVVVDEEDADRDHAGARGQGQHAGAAQAARVRRRAGCQAANARSRNAAGHAGVEDRVLAIAAERRPRRGRSRRRSRRRRSPAATSHQVLPAPRPATVMTAVTNASSARSPSGYARFVATVGERAVGARHDADHERCAERGDGQRADEAVEPECGGDAPCARAQQQDERDVRGGVDRRCTRRRTRTDTAGRPCRRARRASTRRRRSSRAGRRRATAHAARSTPEEHAARSAQITHASSSTA